MLPSSRGRALCVSDYKYSRKILYATIIVAEPVVMRTTKSLNLKVMHAPRCKPRSPVPTRARPILEHHRKIAIINRGAQLLALGLPPAHTPREYARAAGGRIYGCFGGNGCSGGACIGQGECMRVCRTGTAGTRGMMCIVCVSRETGSLFHSVLKTGRFALGQRTFTSPGPWPLICVSARRKNLRSPR